MLDLILAAALAQTGTPPEPDRCNAAGRAAQPIAGCTTWEAVRRDAQGEGYVDPASVRRDGDQVEVQVRLLLPEPVEGARSIQTRLRLNCAARTREQLLVAAFDAGGRMLSQFAPPPEPPQPVQSGSPLGDLLARICGR